MAKRKPVSGQRLKQTRSALAALKKAGLFTGDARKAKGGWRQQKLIKQYSDVISGKAKAIKVGKDASSFAKEFRAKLGRVVVSAKKGEKLRYSKKSGTITSSREEYGVEFKRIVVKTAITKPSDIPDNPPKGKKWLYKLPHNPLRDRHHVVELLMHYKGKKGFMEALEIYEIDASQFPDSEEDLEESEGEQ